LSHRLKIAGRLFDLISGVSAVDHPLCADCADELIIKLEKRLSEVRKEKDGYATYLRGLEEEEEAEKRDGEEEWDKEKAHAQLAMLQEKERNALSVLDQLEKEKGELKVEMEAVEEEMKKVNELEASYWQDVNSFQEEIYAHQNEKESIDLRLQYASKQLEKLKKTNVYNDTFRIWHDGPFGTINGFRMGRLPNQPVDWSEINAAMGQALLLLDTLANKLNFMFKGYRLVPMGSFSRIEKIDGDKGSYELYGSGDLKGMLFWNRRFDNALVAFLNCLQQLGDYAEQQDPKFRLPYRSV
ncbi:Atg6/Beclin, partial [Blyttiomyces helicus]